MPRFIRFLLLTVLLGLAWAYGVVGVDEARAGPLHERWRQRPQAVTALPAPGQSAVLTLNGRHVLLHVPPRYQPGQPMPLVLALHGGGGSRDLMADDRRYGLISHSEHAGYLLVLPNGTGAIGDKLATWNAGACCGRARDTAVDDVAFLRAVVAWVQQHYAVAPGRVYAVGMSNGGMMAYRLACEAADVFAGVASVAGTDNTLSCQPSRPLAVLHIHARDDDHVLFDGGAGAGAFRDDSKVADFTSVPVTVSRWQQRNQCHAQPLRSLDLPGAYCERYAGCAVGGALQLCVTTSGGHGWPGGGRARLGKAVPSQALDANAVFWRFFSQLPPRP